MLLMLCTLASGAEITVRQTASGVQAVDDQGALLSAREFAERVGDHDTLAERQAIYRRMRTSTGLLTWGGLGVAAVGGVGALVGIVDGNNLMALGFGSAGAAGAFGFVAGGSLYLASRNHLNDMDRWYTLQEAQAWVDRMDADAPEPAIAMTLVATARGYDVVYDGLPMSTQAFARQIGDLDTYRVCKMARTGLMVGGIGSFVVGGYAMLLGVAPDNDAGVPLVMLAAGGSALAMGAGMLALRSVLDRPQIWYSQHEAQAWIDQSTATSPQSQRPALQVAVAPTLLPADDRLAPGVGLSGRW